MSKPTCIFHHPFPVGGSDRLGSGVRPVRMIEALEQIGYEVEVVAGYSLDRARRIQAVLERVRSGKVYDFVYSESHTLPTALTDPHHLPLRALQDLRFLGKMRTAGVRVGLFYRDAYWRFDAFAQAYAWWKRVPAVAFYRSDWRMYERVVDHLFLPSMRMATVLPSRWDDSRMSALPPGTRCSERRRAITAEHSRGELRLIYVGGVAPPLYDLGPLFDVLDGSPSLRLTLCCREDEWIAHCRRYRVPENVTIVHKSGADLESLYTISSAAVVFRAPHPYLDMAMPVKVFEALGYGLPVITNPGTEVARFVEQERVGWVVTADESFRNLVASLTSRPGLLAGAHQRAREVCQSNTWKARAHQVRSVLMGESD